MAYMTVTFTDATKGPYSLATLFAGGTPTASVYNVRAIQ